MITLSSRARTGRAFSLVELLIVILIIAILLAVAIPRLFANRRSADDRAAQSTLRNAATVAEGFYADANSYAGATNTAMAEVEPNIEFVAANTASTKDGNSRTVSVSASADTWTAAAAAEGNGCWYLQLNAGTDSSGNPVPNRYGFKESSGSSPCSAASPPTSWETTGFPSR